MLPPDLHSHLVSGTVRAPAVAYLLVLLTSFVSKMSYSPPVLGACKSTYFTSLDDFPFKPEKLKTTTALSSGVGQL